MRGSIEGSLWALLVGGVGLALASVAAEPPVPVQSPTAPQLAAPAVPSPDPSGVAPARETDIPMAAPAPTPDVADQTDTPVTPEPESTPPLVMAETAQLGSAPQGMANGPRPVLRAAPLPDTPAFDPPAMPSQPQPPVIDTALPAPYVPPAADGDSYPVAETPAPDAVAPRTAQAPAAPADDVAPQADTLPEPVAVAVPAPQIEAQAPVQVQDQQPAPPQVRINRPTDDAAQDPVAEPQAPAPDEGPDMPALARYAAAFENPQDLPLIGVVLVDDGQMTDPSAALSALGFAPTVAIDILDANAADRVALLRGAGAEVAMQVALPQGAQPADVEVTFEAAAAAMAEVGILFSDGTDAVQNDRAVTTQVMSALAGEGRGFVNVQRGLGNASRIADQSAVPNVTVFRDIDGNGESAAAIGRALDQAALRARQSGGVVLMGRLTPQTLQALRGWVADVSSDDVAAAPVSAILLGQ